METCTSKHNMQGNIQSTNRTMQYNNGLDARSAPRTALSIPLHALDAFGGIAGSRSLAARRSGSGSRRSVLHGVVIIIGCCAGVGDVQHRRIYIVCRSSGFAANSSTNRRCCSVHRVHVGGSKVGNEMWAPVARRPVMQFLWPAGSRGGCGLRDHTTTPTTSIFIRGPDESESSRRGTASTKPTLSEEYRKDNSRSRRGAS